MRLAVADNIIAMFDLLLEKMDSINIPIKKIAGYIEIAKDRIKHAREEYSRLSRFYTENVTLPESKYGTYNSEIYDVFLEVLLESGDYEKERTYLLLAKGVCVLQKET